MLIDLIKMKIFLYIILLLYVKNGLCCLDSIKCTCANTRAKSSDKGKELTCVNGANIPELFSNAKFPEDSFFVSMNLSNNDIVNITQNTFGNRSIVRKTLSNVLRLNLAENKIQQIIPGSFQLFGNLTRLNLSRNNIGKLSQDMFKSLKYLKTLDISHNNIPIIPGDAFTPYKNLRKLYLSSSFLVCNCLMKPFVMWLKENSTDIKTKGTCYFPVAIRGKALKKLETDEMCNAKLGLSELPHFYMMPSFDQLAFVGDSLTLQCEGTDFNASQVLWEFNDEEVDFGVSSFINSTTTQHVYRTVIAGKLTIDNLQLNHSGTWKCTVRSNYGSQAESLNLLVTSRSPLYCNHDNVTNDRGYFHWKQTIAGGTMALSCQEDKTSVFYAHRTCSKDGSWMKGNYAQCPYKDPISRLAHEYLLQFHTINARAEGKDNSEDLIKKSTEFKDTLRSQTFREPFSLELIKFIFGNFTQHAIGFNDDKNKDAFGSFIISVASHTMTANTALLKQAQQQYNACSKILYWIRFYATWIKTDLVVMSDNIYLQTLSIKGDTMGAMLCEAELNKETKHFHQPLCIYGAKIEQVSPEKQSMYLPSEFFDQFYKKDKLERFYVIIFRNAALFETTSDLVDEYIVDDDAFVFESSLLTHDNVNMSHPIHYTIQSSNPLAKTALRWTGSSWSKLNNNCSVVPGSIAEKLKQLNMTRIICNQLTNVTIKIKPPHAYVMYYDLIFVHPAVFVGSGVLVICMLIVLITYLVLPGIVISSEATHMLMNQCFHLMLVTCAFAVGIRRVDFIEFCTACGIILHYASLANVLWAAISARNIYKEMVQASLPPLVDVKPPRPMLRFYLVGCGIPIMICGITAAAKIRHYGDDGQYCWLSWETSLFSFYIPAALAALVCIGFQVRVLLALNRYANDGTGRTNRHSHLSWQQRNSSSINSEQRYNNVLSSSNVYENTPLQQNNNRRPTETFANNEHMSVVNPTDACNEQSFGVRLRSVTLLLVLFIATWLSAAVSVAAPVLQETPTVDLATSWKEVSKITYTEFKRMTEENTSRVTLLGNLFAFIFACLAVAMGIFILVQHVVSRKDIRTSFQQHCSFSCCRKNKYSDIRTGTSLTARDDDSHYHTHNNVREDVNSQPETMDANTPSSYEDNNGVLTKRIQRPRENTVGTITTDPTTIETVLQSTAFEEESLISMQTSKNKQMSQNVNPSNYSNGVSGLAPNMLAVLNSSHNSFMATSSAYQSPAYLIPPQSSHGVNSLNCNQQNIPSSSGKPLYILHSSSNNEMSQIKDHTMHRSSSMKKYKHHSLPHQHHSTNGYSGAHYKHMQQQQPYAYPPHPYLHHMSCTHQPNDHKRLKLNNLQMESSMTEHSLDEVANMHTVPVIMQHHKQPKINNSMALYRYQKVRKKLEQKRGKSRKLTVLREYAQDPLTSNDEDENNKNIRKNSEENEGNPLLVPTDDDQSRNIFSSSLAQQHSYAPTEQSLKYRTLLLSSPTHQQRLDGKVTPHNHQEKSNDRKMKRKRNGDHVKKNTNGGNRVTRMKNSHNDSERERCTTSSENDKDGSPYTHTLAAQQPPKTTAPPFSNTQIKVPSPVKSSHGYLTMQHLVQGGFHIKSSTVVANDSSKLPMKPSQEARQPDYSSEEEKGLIVGADYNNKSDRDPLSLSFSDTAEESELEFTKNLESGSTTSPSVMSTWQNETSV